mmetsp:Transcript_2074/g.2343  ORF Transcript_2074/g.2343 Transcript_2074/m.2343 type:complete len:159 (-) Transcript_2074:148-624(-)
MSTEFHSEQKKLKHAQNLLMKKRLNQKYFDINTNVSKQEIFNNSPEDFVFADKSKVKRADQKAKFLKKYLKMKEVQKMDRDRIRKLKTEKQRSILQDIQGSNDGRFPDLSYYTTQHRGKDSLADSPEKSLVDEPIYANKNIVSIQKRSNGLDLDLINN